MRSDLSAKLAAYRSAAARNENCFAFDITYDFVDIDFHRVSSEKILNVDLTHGGNGNLTVRKLIKSGENFNGATRVVTSCDNFAESLFIDGGHSYVYFVHAVLFDEFSYFVSRADDLNSVYRSAYFFGIVVDDADGIEIGFIGSLHFGDKRRARFSRADNHNPRFFVVA